MPYETHKTVVLQTTKRSNKMQRCPRPLTLPSQLILFLPLLSSRRLPLPAVFTLGVSRSIRGSSLKIKFL